MPNYVMEFCQQQEPLYIFKSRCTYDPYRDSHEYILFNSYGHETDRLTMRPNEAKAFAADIDLKPISCADLLRIEREGFEQYAARLSFNGLKLTASIVEKTRQAFADNYKAMLDEMPADERNGSRGNWLADNWKAMLAGESDHTVTFLQRAHFIQTGESIGLLSKASQVAK